MKKKRKIKKNVIVILFFIIIFIIGVFIYMKKDNVTRLIFKETENLIEKEIKSSENYEEKNFDKYLSYINKYNAPVEDTIYLINNDIDYDYSTTLVDLSKEQYFIKKNLPLYLNYLSDDLKETIKNVNTNIIYEYYTNQKSTDTTKYLLMIVNKYYHLDENFEPSDLESIDPAYNTGANNKLRHDAKEAFEKMCAQAQLENIKLYNISAYRSYQTQYIIYNRNVANRGVEMTDKTSARPGNSEHQTGLATDINSLDTDFQYTQEYKWLINNSYKFGFILRYPKDYIKITGYNYEPWHYRYVGIDVAKTIHDSNITYEEYYAYYVDK